MNEEPTVETTKPPELEDLLGAYGSAFDLVVAERTSDEPLYHYTSAEGLRGILSTGVLHGSNFSFVNDSAELEFGYRIARPLVEQRFNSETGKEGELLRLALKYVEHAFRLQETYIFSLCEEPDVLSQWRGYGSAGRYAIGFRRGGLWSDYPRRVVPFKVAYGPSDTLSERVQKFANRIVGALKQFDARVQEADNSKVEEFARLIALSFQHLTATFKHRGFEEEREWRLVWTSYSDNDPVEFIVRSGEIQPFITLVGNGKHGNLPITDVWSGYSHHKDRAMKATGMLLRRYGYDRAKVASTELTFVE